MKYVLVTLILLSVIPAYAQDKPLTGREYAANAIAQKEAIVMQLLDEIVSLKKQIEDAKKSKEDKPSP